MHEASGKAEIETPSQNGPGKFVAGKLRAAHQSLSNHSNPALGPAAIGLLGPLSGTGAVGSSMSGGITGGGGPGQTGPIPTGLTTASLSEREIQVRKGSNSFVIPFLRPLFMLWHDEYDVNEGG